MNRWDIYSETASNEEFGFQESFDFSHHERNSYSQNTLTLDSVLPTRGWPKAELSEVHCFDSDSVLQLLLPTLAKLNAQNRWITLIAPPADINQTLFAYYGIDTSRVLLIHPKDDVDDKVTMNKALKNGTSGVVILWTSQIDKRYLAQWRKSVKQGCSIGIIVNLSAEIFESISVALSFGVSTHSELLSVLDIKLFGVKQPQHKEILFSKVDLDQVMEQQLLQGFKKEVVN